MSDHARFEVNVGTETDPDWQPIPAISDVDFAPDPDTTDTIPTAASWSFEATFTRKPPKWQACRRWAHRLGILCSPADTLMGVPFGFSRHHTARRRITGTSIAAVEIAFAVFLAVKGVWPAAVLAAAAAGFQAWATWRPTE